MRNRPLTKETKLLMFSRRIKQNKINSKSLWKSLKKFFNTSLKGDDNICFHKIAIAGTFILFTFYPTVAKLVEKLTASIHRYGTNFIYKFYADKGVTPNSFLFL